MKNLQKWQPRQANNPDEGWGVIIDGTLAKPQWVIFPQRQLDHQDAGLIVATHNGAIEQRPERSIWCTSLVNSRLEPVVQITVGPEVAQFKIREARQHVAQLQEAIEAAMADALLTRFIRDVVYAGHGEVDTQRAIGQMLVMFREFRNAMDEPISSETES